MKRLAWFIIKSPQRKLLGYGTLLTDIRGLLEYSFNRLKRIFIPLKEVTICTGLHNRSSNYLNIFLESLQKIEHKEKVTLSVFDCNSNDLPELETEIRNKWAGKLIFNAEKIPFSRSVSFNKAVKQAQTDLIFICDADIAVGKDLVQKCNNNVSKHVAWFPICFWLDKEKKEFHPENGKFFTEGTGLLACSKKQFETTGGYNENITSWGKEDWDLFFRFYTLGIMPLRTREKQLLHHWHPSQKPEDFVPVF